MPQLDKLTFLTQFTYLIIFYFGFYLLLVKHFLPRLARLIKIRQAKIALAASPLQHTEKANIQDKANSYILHAAQNAKHFFSDRMSSVKQLT